MIHPSTSIRVQLVYGAVLVIIPLGWYSLVAVSFSHPAAQRFFGSIQQGIDKLTGALLILLGLKVAVSASK